MILYIFLSHDVDWRKQGPEKEHIKPLMVNDKIKVFLRLSVAVRMIFIKGETIVHIL